MFWGVKLEKGKRYSQLVEKSFHISHAALTTCEVKTKHPVEVHVVVENTDYILCYLGHLDNQLLVQHPLDLNISEGEEIEFYVANSNGSLNSGASEEGVYLTGYFREDPEVPFNLDELLDHEDEDDEDVTEKGSDIVDDEPGDDDALWTALMMNESLSETDSDEDYTVGDDDDNLSRKNRLPIKGKPVIEEIIEENVPVQSGSDGTEKQGSKKRKRDKAKDSTDVSTLSLNSKSEAAEATPKVKRRKKMDSDQKKETTPAKKTTTKDDSDETAKQKKKKEKATPLSLVTSGGTQVQDLKIGTGKVAKSGKKVFVKFTGRLAHNQKIFDSNLTSKKPFMFRLGQREVIAGWDEGIHGMKVGGKRKLLIPPAQGYGSRGSPPQIPPNSRLIFDVELIDLK